MMINVEKRHRYKDEKLRLTNKMILETEQVKALTNRQTNDSMKYEIQKNRLTHRQTEKMFANL